MTDSDPLQALIQAFPRLFRGQHPKVASSLPPGWYGLVQAMFADIDALLDDTEAPQFRVVQIKQKFGGLRVYFQRGKEATLTADLQMGDARGVRRISLDPEPASPTYRSIRARVGRAEQESFSICESCGSAGASLDRSRAWIRTLCTRCRVARSARVCNER